MSSWQMTHNPIVITMYNFRVSTGADLLVYNAKFFVALFNKVSQETVLQNEKIKKKIPLRSPTEVGNLLMLFADIAPPPPPSNPPNCNLGNSFHLLIQRNGHRKDFLLIFKRHGKFSYFVHVWVKGPC